MTPEIAEALKTTDEALGRLGDVLAGLADGDAVKRAAKAHRGGEEQNDDHDHATPLVRVLGPEKVEPEQHDDRRHRQ